VCRSQGGLTQHLHATHSRQPQIQPPALHLNQLEAEDLGGHPNIPHAEELISEQLPNTGFESEHSERAVPSPTADTNTPLDDTTDTNTPLNISFHPILNGTPCDIDGNDLPLNTPPPAQETVQDFSLFTSHAEFELTDFLFMEVEMSAGKIDRLMELFAALNPDCDPPFADHQELYNVIDSIPHGDIPWKCFTVSYSGEIPQDGAVPAWKHSPYEVWYRDPLLVMEQQIGNPMFAGQIDFAPKRVFDKDRKRIYTDLMSGEWAWKQAVSILFFSFIFHALICAEQTCSRLPTNSWSMSCSHCLRKRQNNSVRCNRTKRILSVICIHWTST